MLIDLKIIILLLGVLYKIRELASILSSAIAQNAVVFMRAMERVQAAEMSSV